MPEAKRILVVDDSATATAFAAETLRRAGFVVETANDIWIAQLVSIFQPHLILMDVHLRGGSRGTLAVRALHHHHVGQKAQILLYSGMAEDELSHLARECGAHGYIRKTDSAETLVSSVRKCLETASC